jgi:hypothetical protein
MSQVPTHKGVSAVLHFDFVLSELVPEGTFWGCELTVDSDTEFVVLEMDHCVL